MSKSTKKPRLPREMWTRRPATQVVSNKKGKGSYNRQREKRVFAY